MRCLGSLSDHAQRERALAFFAGHGIAVSIDEDGDHPEVWGVEEDTLAEAERLLKTFEADPSDAAIDEAVAKGRKVKPVATATAGSRYTVKSRTEAFKSVGLRHVPVTLVLLGGSLLVALISEFGDNAARLQPLLIEPLPASGELFSAVRSGQVWRLVTPILIHFGLIHLLFNMLWLRDLGGMLEVALGKWRFAAMILVLAVVPNVCEYLFGCGPSFGGMSGVVYGLLGYAYVRGRRDLTSGVYVAPQTAMMMGIWFVLCVVGIIPDVANVVHGVGLLIGAAWGWFDSLPATKRS
jgi:GlpG protein